MTINQQGINEWQRYRQRLRRWFWIYLTIAGAGATIFILTFSTRDSYVFAILLAIPLISLRQAWRMDRQIVQCDKHITAPIITQNKEKS